MSNSTAKTRRLTMCALFAALTGVCSQIVIPLPMIPINLALLAVHLAGALLGKSLGAFSMIVYAALGICGIPVFANFGAGPAILLGKTGGYVLGYIICAFIVGLMTQKKKAFLWTCFSMVIGVAACYTFGTIWFMLLTKMDLWTSLVYCVFPFLIGDAVKILLAAYLAGRLQRQVGKLL